MGNAIERCTQWKRRAEFSECQRQTPSAMERKGAAAMRAWRKKCRSTWTCEQKSGPPSARSSRSQLLPHSQDDCDLQRMLEESFASSLAGVEPEETYRPRTRNLRSQQPESMELLDYVPRVRLVLMRKLEAEI